MVQNRLAKVQLIKKLTELKKANNFPVKPTLNPAILYVENVLNPQNLTWDHPPHIRGQVLNEVIKRAIQSWPKMDPIVKGNIPTIIEFKILELSTQLNYTQGGAKIVTVQNCRCV